MQPLAGPLEGNPAIDFLTSRIDYERTLSVPYGQRDFRLDRMHKLAALLGNPQDSLRIVHIAGTKGKGSTAAMIESMLRAAGFRTGLYSSPHLDRLEERLRVDGIECSADDLADLVERLRPAVAALDAEPGDFGHGPTYFEIITAMALVHFQLRRVDAAVLEVGLGGRLDSTNICQPLVSVITSISFDHTQQLGSTLSAIAGEKAGIVKPGTPLVSGVLQDEPREVIAQAAQQQGCRIVQLGSDFHFQYTPPRHLETAHQRGHIDFQYSIAGVALDLAGLELNLTGCHQAANAAVAIATVMELRRNGWNIPDSSLRQGLAQVKWPARVEVIGRKPTVVLDAAHNVASVIALVQSLHESFATRRRLLVFATSRDKDVRGMLQVLLGKFDEVIFTRYWNNPRGVPPEELKAIAEELSPGATVHVCADSATAWQLANQLATPEDLICITGSFFLAAEIRTTIEHTN